jgi:hypothetical protein
MSAHIFNAREVSDYWQELQRSNQSNLGKFSIRGTAVTLPLGLEMEDQQQTHNWQSASTRFRDGLKFNFKLLSAAVWNGT